MGLTLKELLALKVDLFTIEESNDCLQIIIHCIGCESCAINIDYCYGELLVSATNDEIQDSKSLFLGFDVDIDDITIEKQAKQIVLTFPNED